MVSGVVKSAALAAAFLHCTAAMSNTSPVFLLSDSQPLAVPEDAPRVSVPSMGYVFDTVAAHAVKKCGYDSYIFVKQHNVSDRAITRESMPFLVHAMEKAVGKYVYGTVVNENGVDIDETVGTLKASIQSQCDALPISADVHARAPFAAYSDTNPRIISVELPTGVSAEEADESIKHIVGHLPSSNFLLAYYTTPFNARGTDEEDPSVNGVESQSSSPSSSSSSSSSPSLSPSSFSESSETGEVPYESVFRNYQFFSPALFMGLIVSTFLLFVFIIAFNSVGSLQISQAAFEPRRDVPKKKQQ